MVYDRERRHGWLNVCVRERWCGIDVESVCSVRACIVIVCAVPGSYKSLSGMRMLSTCYRYLHTLQHSLTRPSTFVSRPAQLVSRSHSD